MVFGPWTTIGDTRTWVFTLGIDHYEVMARISLYQDAAYDGNLRLVFLTQNVSVEYGSTPPSASYTLDGLGNEWGFVKSTPFEPHSYSADNSNH